MNRLNIISKGMIVPFVLVSLLFLLWGVANNMNDTLLAAFKRIMSMNDIRTSLVQFAFYGAYFCFAIPAALFIKRYSYKSGILLGLVLYALGTMLFYPSGVVASYGFFLFAIYVMAGGCAILETTANPYILSMGPAETATRRLNVAQMFNPIGAVCGILISRYFILSELHAADATTRANMSAESLSQIQHQELAAVSSTYFIIGCVLLLLLSIIAIKKMPVDKSEDSSTYASDTLQKLWLNKQYRYGVVAQFFYVGAQTCVWSFTIRLGMAELDIYETEASVIFLYSILAFTLFRFFFTWLMGYVAPRKLLVSASLIAILCSATVAFTHGSIAIVALVAISACMSLMFPTIYGMALDGISGNDAKIAASGLIMAILGGALITPLQAFVSDAYGISVSFVVPGVCFVVVLIYSLLNNIIAVNDVK